MSSRSFGIVVLFVTALAGMLRRAAADPVLPDFSAANFEANAPIDNIYYPLVPGTNFRYTGNLVDVDTGEPAGFERDEDFVTNKTELIAGVTTRIVHARVWLDDLLIEDTQDYFAQDKSGNVWYMGEDTTEFERDDEGNVIGTNTEGSWRAGVHDGKPGFIMPANPQVGFSYFQESAPNDGAVDEAQILSLTESISGPGGSFANVLKTLEFTELEPGVFEHKFYAPGVGQVLVEEDLNDAGVPLNTLQLQSITTAIPLPPAVGPGLAMLGAAIGMVSVRRYRRSAS